MGPKSNAVLTVGGEPRGYALYRVKAEWGDRGPKNTLNVLEVTALDPAAERALWEWLVGIDLVGQVKAWRVPPVHNPLLLQVAEPQRLGLTIRDGIWLRLVDLRAALEARTYAGPGRLTLDVTDAFVPSNAGRWTVDVPDDRGAASATPAEGVVPDVALDIADLATVYLGAFTFADLVRAGRARECRDGAAVVADTLFAAAAAPWCSTMF